MNSLRRAKFVLSCLSSQALGTALSGALPAVQAPGLLQRLTSLRVCPSGQQRLFGAAADGSSSLGWGWAASPLLRQAQGAATAAAVGGAQLRQAAWRQLGGVRHASRIVPRFTGGKLKPYSAYKNRFKTTGTGKIRYMRPGHVHKHFNKSSRQNHELARTQVMHEAYAKVMRKVGFVSRRF